MKAVKRANGKKSPAVIDPYLPGNGNYSGLTRSKLTGTVSFNNGSYSYYNTLQENVAGGTLLHFAGRNQRCVRDFRTGEPALRPRIQ